jgi:hypothetical protein
VEDRITSGYYGDAVPLSGNGLVNDLKRRFSSFLSGRNSVLTCDTDKLEACPGRRSRQRGRVESLPGESETHRTDRRRSGHLPGHLEHGKVALGGRSEMSKLEKGQAGSLSYMNRQQDTGDLSIDR